MHAHQHLDAQAPDRAVAFLEPSPEPAGDHSEQQVVDRPPRPRPSRRDARRRADGRRTRPDAVARRARSAATCHVRESARVGSRPGRRGAPRGSPADGCATRPDVGSCERCRGPRGPGRKRGRDQLVRRGQRLGRGKGRGVGLGVGRVAPQQRRTDRHRRLPVSHRMVDAPDHGPAAVLERLDDVDRPQGRSRGSRSAISPATISRSSPAPTGPVTGTSRTWRRTSKLGSSAHTARRGGRGGDDPPPAARRERDATRSSRGGTRRRRRCARRPRPCTCGRRSIWTRARGCGSLGRQSLRHRVGSITTPNGAGRRCPYRFAGNERA